MNMFKKNGGFTLVELIVVIAILAILAGVAVPAYSSYINRAEQAKDLQNLSSINTAVQGVAAAEGITVTAIEVTAAKALKVNNAENVIKQADVEVYTGSIASMPWSDSWNGATWSNTDAEWTLTPKSGT